VRFCEVDAYRVAWHGHYAAWMELGRNDLARRFGLDAEQLLEAGYLAPVVKLTLSFLRPLRYHDECAVLTTLVPSEAATLRFSATIVDPAGAEAARGETVHGLTDLSGTLQYRVPPGIAERIGRMTAWLEEG
jgi:acyl-CoA thioester hydrolase